MTTPRDNDALQIRKWAATGNVVTPESVGITRAEGWDVQYSTPGGKLPEREVINQLFRELTALGDEVNRRGCGLQWDVRIAYLHPAVVTGSDGALYVSVQANANQDPTADSGNSYWRQVGITRSDADIKAAYERNANTNALTDALLTMLQGATPLANPTFTGNPRAPTQTAGNNSTSLATTAFVQAAIAALVASAPSTLNTLNELADALGDDPNFAATIMTMIAAAATRPGTIMDYAGTLAPSGYLLCDGAAVSRTTYTNLFAAIGTTWGNGDGSTTFNVPNFRRRVAVGSGGTGGNGLGNSVGSTGGAETHTLAVDEMPTHTHGVRTNWSGIGSTTRSIDLYTHPYNPSANQSFYTSTSAGGGNSHNNLQPSAVVLKIIKT